MKKLKGFAMLGFLLGIVIIIPFVKLVVFCCKIMDKRINFLKDAQLLILAKCYLINYIRKNLHLIPPDNAKVDGEFISGSFPKSLEHNGTVLSKKITYKVRKDLTFDHMVSFILKGEQNNVIILISPSKQIMILTKKEIWPSRLGYPRKGEFEKDPSMRMKDPEDEIDLSEYTSYDIKTVKKFYHAIKAMDEQDKNNSDNDSD